MLKATIFDIERSSFVDGPGIRTTVFFKGCNLRCEWCHNPESQSSKKEMLFYKNKCTDCGKCREKCPNSLNECTLCGECSLFCPQDARVVCGREYTVEEVFREIEKDKPFYASSGGGVTFSGGECMLQADFLSGILKLCRENGIHTAVDTAGCVPFESFEKVMPYTDMFLYDIKCFDNEKHKKYTGVGNSIILENLKKLLAMDKKVWVRIPVIPTVNDTEEEMLSIRKFLDECGYPEKVELLGYHTLGENKYHAIGKETIVFSVPDEDTMDKLKECFRV